MDISKKELKKDFELVKMFYDKFVFEKSINNDKIKNKAGIGGNTFRSLRIYKKNHPSDIFRQWAFDQYDNLKAQIIKNPNLNYINLHVSMVESLETTFEKKKIKYSKKEIKVPYSICAKFIDLFIEFCIQPNKDLPHKEQLKISKYFKQNAFIPLDSYTLKAISCLLQNDKSIDTTITEKINFRNELLKNFQTLSMGFIFKLSKGNAELEKKIYYKVQGLIDEIMRINKLKYERIYFDKWAWNNPDFK